MPDLPPDQIALLERLDGFKRPQNDDWYPRSDVFYRASGYDGETLNTLVASGWAEESGGVVRITAKGVEALAAFKSG